MTQATDNNVTINVEGCHFRLTHEGGEVLATNSQREAYATAILRAALHGVGVTYGAWNERGEWHVRHYSLEEFKEVARSAGVVCDEPRERRATPHTHWQFPEEDGWGFGG